MPNRLQDVKIIKRKWEMRVIFLPIKIVHCADIHIGAAHSALGAAAARRSAEVLHSLYSVAELCREQKADALLIAGDLFDNPCPDSESVKAVSQYLASIPETEVFIAAGNHDYLTPSSPYFGEFSENVHIFKDGECLEFDSYRVYGRSFYSSFEQTFSLPKAEQDQKINILLMHGDIFGGPYNPLTEAALSETGMDFVALGHVHAPSGVKFAGQVPFAYPGSCEPLGFDETGIRGALVGTVYKGDIDLNLRRLCRRVYHEIRVNTAPFSDAGQLQEHLREILLPLKDDMVKIILEGECVFSPDCNRLLAALDGLNYYLKLKNRTYPKENLTLLREEQTLKGIFTDKMLRLIETSDGDQKAEAEAALRLGLAAFAGREVGINED